MLSYQHAYHAGNLADVHKHGLMATALDYLTRKDKPLSYLESHAGRGLYDLSSPEAVKTGEAAAAASRVQGWFAPDHAYARALASVRARHGATAYPGSPLIAEALLRASDTMTLAELHPQEAPALARALSRPARVLAEDGFAMLRARTPPDPRRGLALIDPSYELKGDYDRIPGTLAQLNRTWNVGVVMLWYPILASDMHRPMTRTIAEALPDAMIHEVRFPPHRPGHGMFGSGMVVVNAPWGLAEEAARLSDLFAAL